jgi:asparagine synthase (glutamine-hydrolysing)
MCGFYGELNSDNVKDSIGLGLEKIQYRGPDHSRMMSHKNYKVGFNRLAIIDLDESASQPMCSAKGNHIIVFNGEIYNYKEIRSDLTKSGYQFRTKSDTEVLLYAYIHYGKKCLDKINGMFSFAIYDKVKMKIFLARDRSGQKPLVYYYEGNKFYFGSELKSILSNIEPNIKISKKGLLQYLALGYIVSPLSFYEKIHKLQPGHYIEFNTDMAIDNIIQKRYWHPNFDQVDTSMAVNTYEDELYELLIDSIKLRLNSDVPLAVFLSGGLDSTVISSIIAKEKLAEINAFTVDFDVEQMSEIKTVKSFLKKYPEIKHDTVNLQVEDMLKDLSVIDKLDEPFSDSSIIPSYWIAKEVKERKFTVAIGGDGGDELLGGYYKNRPFSKYDIWYKYTNDKSRYVLSKLMNIKNRQIGERIALSNEARYWLTRSNTDIYKSMSLFTEKFKEFKSDSIFPTDNEHHSSTFSLFETYDYKYRLSDGYLTKVDKASMYNSLEVRNPFLDFRIIELLMKMPKEYKLKNNITKVLLRNIAEKKSLLVNEVLTQKKTGFSIPLRDWVTVELKSDIVSAIIGSCLKDYVHEARLMEMFSLGLKKGMHNSYIEIIWRLYVLAKVLIKYNIRSL